MWHSHFPSFNSTFHINRLLDCLLALKTLISKISINTSIFLWSILYLFYSYHKKICISIFLSYRVKGKTNLDFTEARDSECQWHQLGHMQVCTSLQTDNYTSTPPLSILQAGRMPFLPPDQQRQSTDTNQLHLPLAGSSEYCRCDMSRVITLLPSSSLSTLPEQ